jgi:hypothetical protein
MIRSLGTTVVKPALKPEKAEPSWQAMTVDGPTAHRQLIANFQCHVQDWLDWTVHFQSGPWRHGLGTGAVQCIKHRLKMQFKWKRHHLDFFSAWRHSTATRLLYVWLAYIVPPAATSGKSALCPHSAFVFCMIPTMNKYVHKSICFYHDTNCGLRRVRSGTLYLINKNFKILKQSGINWKLLYQESKFAVMDPYLVRCLDGHSPLLTFGVGVSICKSLQHNLRWRISNI